VFQESQDIGKNDCRPIRIHGIGEGLLRKFFARRVQRDRQVQIDRRGQTQ
jgi:hypothetical protein